MKKLKVEQYILNAKIYCVTSHHVTPYPVTNCHVSLDPSPGSMTSYMDDPRCKEMLANLIIN